MTAINQELFEQCKFELDRIKAANLVLGKLDEIEEDPDELDDETIDALKLLEIRREELSDGTDIERRIQEATNPLEITQCKNIDPCGSDYWRVLFCFGGPMIYAEKTPHDVHASIYGFSGTDRVELVDYDDEIEIFYGIGDY